MRNGHEETEDLFEMLYQAQMRMLMTECERLFAPLGDLVKDEEFSNEIIVAA